MGLLLQITMSWLCALSRQGAGDGCRCRVLVLTVVLGAGCCELAVRVVETVTGCQCRVLVLGAVNWLCAW